jgi:Rrf2 family transcriptional regulator, cysteine metabolism repressor
MKLTTHSEYGLLALIYICRAKGKGHIPLSKIARVQKLPVKYMEHLMQAMCHAGYLSSLRGKSGGYQLMRPANKITIAEIIRLFDGPLAPTESVSTYFYKSTPIEKEKRLLGLMQKIRDYIVNTLENTTIADVL